jgi:predicted aspartyl protease
LPARALVDTGASCTCVDLTVLQQLAIPTTGTTPLLTPSTGQTPHTVNQYDVSIVIVFGNPFKVLFGAHTMPVVEADLRPQGILALIGRDVLLTGILQYNGETELFTLAF